MLKNIFAQLLKYYRNYYQEYIYTSINKLFCFLFLFMATTAAYESSQARDHIRGTAADLCHSQGNAGSEPHLQPPQQLAAIQDPQSTEQGQGSNPHPPGDQVKSLAC